MDPQIQVLILLRRWRRVTFQAVHSCRPGRLCLRGGFLCRSNRRFPVYRLLRDRGFQRSYRVSPARQRTHRWRRHTVICCILHFADDEADISVPLPAASAITDSTLELNQQHQHCQKNSYPFIYSSCLFLYFTNLNALQNDNCIDTGHCQSSGFSSSGAIASIA